MQVGGAATRAKTSRFDEVSDARWTRSPYGSCMAISRSDGYRRAQGKEEGGLAAAEHFFTSSIGVEMSRITGAQANYVRGDLESPAGVSVECKRQPIDPAKYKQNFVEVCEATTNPRHVGGLQTLSEVLNVEPDRLGRVRWKLAKSSHTGLLGNELHLSVSISTFRTAALVLYVNPTPGSGHIYVYDSDELLTLIRRRALTEGLVRGAGMSNVDTFAVFVPLPALRWTAVGTSTEIRRWIFTGQGDGEASASHLRDKLG